MNCAPLIDIRRMQSASACHMCGRCAGQRGAVTLSWRSPEAEVLSVPAPSTGDAAQDLWLARLLVFGMLGVALGAFQWSVSPWFIAAKQSAAVWLIDREIEWPLDTVGHWWLFTDYPQLNDAFTWLDGGMLLTYLAATTLLVGGWIWLCLRIASVRAGLSWHRLAMALIPLGGISVFVGLSHLTTGQLFQENIVLAWPNPLRMALLAAAALWSVTLAWRLGRLPAAAGVALAAALPLWAWQQQFYVW